VEYFVSLFVLFLELLRFMAKTLFLLMNILLRVGQRWLIVF